MKSAIPALVLGASIVSASFLPSHGSSKHGRLVARQDDNTTEPIDGLSFGPCQDQCTDFLNLSIKCSEGEDDSGDQDLSEAEAAARYQCICANDFVSAVSKCAACSPEAITGGDSVDSFLRTAALYCKDAGYPIDIGSAASSNTSSTDADTTNAGVSSSQPAGASNSVPSSAAVSQPSGASSASAASSPSASSDTAAGAAVRTDMVSGMTMLVVGVGMYFCS